MQPFLWSYIFVALAAIMNSFMDAFENTPNFNESIFRNLDKKFWCKDVSWQYAERVFGYKLDGWHFAKTLMIVFVAGAIINFRPVHQFWVHLITIGVIWNVVFWLFYHKLFKVK